MTLTPPLTQMEAPPHRQRRNMNTLPLQEMLGQLRHRVRVQQTQLEQAMTAAEDTAAQFRSQRTT